MIGKSIVVQGKGYIRISLNEKETSEAMEELLKFNMKEMERVIAATKNSNMMALSQPDLVKLLFDKQAVSAYTFLQVKLDNKIEGTRKSEQ
jgi:hypothetical protein